MQHTGRPREQASCAFCSKDLLLEYAHVKIFAFPRDQSVRVRGNQLLSSLNVSFPVLTSYFSSVYLKTKGPVVYAQLTCPGGSSS